MGRMKSEDSQDRTAAGHVVSAVTLYQVELALIDVEAQLIRHSVDEDDGILELAASIARRGLLQPIGVTPRGDGRFQLRWGDRRRRACISLGWSTILARIVPMDADGVKGTAILENIQRKQLTLQEEVDAVNHLHYVDKLSPDQIADSVGKGRSWVLRRLAVVNLPPDLRQPLLDGDVTLGAAEEIARLTDGAMRQWLITETVRSKLGVTQVRAAVASLQATPTIGEAIEAGVAASREVQPPLRVLVACDGCGVAKPLEALTLVRVCRDGCGGVSEAREGGGNGAA